VIFRVEGLEDLVRIAATSKFTGIGIPYGHVYYCRAKRICFCFDEPDRRGEFVSVFFTEEEVSGKFLKYDAKLGRMQIELVEGISPHGIFVPLIGLESAPDIEKIPSANPLVLRVKSLADLLRVSTGGAHQIPVPLLSWRVGDLNVYAFMVVQRAFNEARRLFFLRIEPRPIDAPFLRYRGVEREEWGTAYDLRDPKWLYFPIVRLGKGPVEL